VTFVASLRQRAAAVRRRVVFPEIEDTRTLEAVAALSRDGIVEPLLVRDPSNHPARAEVAALLLARRGSKGVSAAQAEALALDPLYLADGLVALGHADACVAGAVHTTADVLRAALWMIGPAAGVTTVSSAFYMVTPGFRGAPEEVLTFTDCAMIPEPTAVQLADIAESAARDRRRIVGDEPRVALLSYSTLGSGAGASVERVREAVAILRARAVDFPVDGELQADAALIEQVGRHKAPGSPVAGSANVLVFPNLDAGNSAYKLVERLARASAIGPIIQGLAKPCSDLSRGASADDIMNVAAIAALQATPWTSDRTGRTT
jgi:phosphate acetyltransferase